MELNYFIRLPLRLAIVLHKTKEHCFQQIDRMVSRAIRDSIQMLIQIDSLQELVRRENHVAKIQKI
jgi:hypothetical protein